jgi:hypothetical protein
MKWAVALVSLLSGAILMFACNMKFSTVLDLVNKRLPNERQISPIGANLRAFEIYRLYRIMYPDGRLHRTCLWLCTSGVACIVITFTMVVMLH